MAHELDHPIPLARESDVDALSQLIRGELAAVDAYQRCIDELGEPIAELAELRDDHRARATSLAAMVRELGVEPARESGLWGAFAQLIEAGAAALGDRAALAALVAGEAHGSGLYERRLDELSGDLASRVRASVLPRQKRSEAIAREVADRFTD